MPKVGRKAVAKVSKAGRKKIFTPDVLLIAGLVFLFALAIRAFGIMDAGITWDEPVYVKTALSYIEYIPKYSLFNAATWQLNFEHPPVAKLIYAVAIKIFGGLDYGQGTFQIARYASALMGALTCAIVFFIGRELYEKRTGILAGLIVALLPLMVAHSQIAALESPLVLFFTLAILLFLIAMKTGDRRIYAAAAVAVGLTIDTKLNGLLLLPIIALMYGSYIYFTKKTPVSKAMLTSALAFVAIVAATVVLLWPWLWADFGTLVHDPLKPLIMTLSHWNYFPNEYFLGVLQQAPIYYLPVYFLVTTPLLVLALCAVGCYYTIKGRDPYRLGILLWLIIPFTYGLFALVQNGTRYIVMVYPAVALMGAFGLSSTVTRLRQAWPRLGEERNLFAAASLLLVIYLIVSLAMVRPYYLDYYNVLSSGQNNIQENRLFEIGYWGEGTKACVDYVESNAAPGSTVLMATIPSDLDHFDFYASKMTYFTFKSDGVRVFNFSENSMYTMDNTTESLSYAWNADYLIVNNQFLTYGGGLMNTTEYIPIYSANVQGARLCTVYKKNGFIQAL
jgi:4-amino-4-deoxy-L-arabinose transferase-like glycosyltransferase